MGGDSNITLDSSLDKTPPPGSQILKPSKLGTKFAKLLHDNDLVDIQYGESSMVPNTTTLSILVFT